MGKKRILIVAIDSIQWGNKVLVDLEEIGYEVIRAADAHAAWHLLAAQSFDVIIVDATTDVVEGCLVTRMLRDRWHTPILVLGSKGSAQFRINCYQAGADVYLVVPLDTAELVARLGGLLRRAELNASGHYEQEEPNNDHAFVGQG